MAKVDLKKWASWKTGAPVPPKAQRKDYTCGPAALRMALGQLGLDVPAESDLEDHAKTTKEAGTRPEDLAAAAQKHGAVAQVKESSTVEELVEALQSKAAIILDLQAASGDADEWEAGHYVVLAGIDPEGQVAVHDPMYEGKARTMSVKELKQRWHDAEADGTVHQNLAIIIKQP